MRQQPIRTGVSRYAPRIVPALVGLGLATALAGCGATAAASSAPTTSSSPSSGTSSPSARTALMKLGSANVAGKQETVLQNGQGMTLYYFTKDTATASHCTGLCTVLWHPLLAGSSAPGPVSGLSGHVTTVSDVHGKQVAYNGHLLYTFSGDGAPGQAKGEGYIHAWWVATPGLPAAATATTSKTSGSSAPASKGSAGSGW
ncbi:MAG: hypothetical protein M0Z53_04670 [Thermaerobacter sp.]|nr:hypothetical protein [Thermaerobacter sp.]